MSNPRTSELICVTGTNGTGKTTVIRKLLKGIGERALICTPDLIEWPDVPEVHHKHTHHIEIYKGLRKIIVSDDNFKETINLIINHFDRGVVVFDDMMAYNTHATIPELKTLLIRRRHKELDIIAVGHSFSEIPPRFYPFFSRFIMSMTTNDVMSRKKELGSALARVLEKKQDQINQAAIKDRYIKAVFTREQLMEAAINE